MVKQLTLVARLSDALPLAEGLETERQPELEPYKTQAKALCKKLAQGGSRSAASRLTVESGPYCFHVFVDKGVVFLTLTERGYPKHAAFRYLGELATEFDLQNGTQVAAATRPYAFVKFDTFIQRTRKLYLDARHGGGGAAQRNVAQLAADLADVRDVVTRSVGEVLGAGERLDDVSAASAHLRAASATYARSARQLRIQAQWRQWAPALAVLGVIVAILFLRWLARALFG